MACYYLDRESLTKNGSTSWLCGTRISTFDDAREQADAVTARTGTRTRVRLNRSRGEIVYEARPPKPQSDSATS